MHHKPVPGLHLILVIGPKFSHCIQEISVKKTFSKIIQIPQKVIFFFFSNPVSLWTYEKQIVPGTIYKSLKISKKIKHLKKSILFEMTRFSIIFHGISFHEI